MPTIFNDSYYYIIVPVLWNSGWSSRIVVITSNLNHFKDVHYSENNKLYNIMIYNKIKNTAKTSIHGQKIMKS